MDKQCDAFGKHNVEYVYYLERNHLMFINQ